MNISLFARLTGLLLVAGFFYSCTNTQQSLDQLTTSDNYDQAVAEINTQLEENPDQPDLHLLKGRLAAEKAKSLGSENRAEYYRITDQSFDDALNYGADNQQLARIDSLRQQYWKLEHNAGLRFFDNTSLTDRFEAASIHFENALILREDAVSSLKNLAITQYERGQLDESINNFQQALELSPEPTVELYENLGYLYLEIGNPEQAIYYYELANQEIPRNFNLAFGLVNAYISSGDNESAVDILEELVQQNPDQPNLRNVYGTQLYEITAAILRDLDEAYQEEDDEMISQLRFEAEGVGEQAEIQLIEAFKRDTSNTEYIESLAVFYNNIAAQYLSLSRTAEIEEQSTEMRAKGLELADFALRYYTMLQEMDPQNEEYQNRLSTLQALTNTPSQTD